MLSNWWKIGVILVLIFGFTVLIWLACRSYTDAPPIPNLVVDSTGSTQFTRQDIQAGQEVFLKYGLMENGSIWGHGAYLGPDYSAAYLHSLAVDGIQLLAKLRYGKPPEGLSEPQRAILAVEVRSTLKENRYHSAEDKLVLSDFEAESYHLQIERWREFFSKPANNAGLPQKYISDKKELAQLTAFFAWTAWASVAERPGKPYSYTNNFPYDLMVGNSPTSDALLWSALSLVSLLGGLAVVLLAVGKFDYLGWKNSGAHFHPQLLMGTTTDSQRATIKYFAVVALLFLAQATLGGALAHYRADPSGFYGIDISSIFPSHILRTWHLQLAIFWIATAYVAGGLFLAPAVGKVEPKGQKIGVHILFGALVLVVVGSLLGEYLGINQLLGKLWFWIGHQGWEYLDLGRAWQILLAGGLVFWLVLLFRALAPALRDPEQGEIASLFMYAAIAIPIFYLPAMFFGSTTHFSVVDTWRFWIIHLWVEGFFELFVTVMVATIFFKLGMVSQLTAVRVVYLDALLYLGSGIIGTGHHWYWTGQSNITMALAAVFSAMEVVPLTLLTLDAADFVKLTRQKCDECGKVVSIPHKWAFYFLIAVGVWNFVGAGIFGFLINLPIVSYFEVGTMLTPNHGHAAMMGVFGMLAVALLVFACRQVLTEEQWKLPERFIKVAFWGLNIGLALMVVTSLFPGGVLQLKDVLDHGYWHARSYEFLSIPLVNALEWYRLPADVIFIGFGVLPLSIAAVLTYLAIRRVR